MKVAQIVSRLTICAGASAAACGGSLGGSDAHDAAGADSVGDPRDASPTVPGSGSDASADATLDAPASDASLADTTPYAGVVPSEAGAIVLEPGDPAANLIPLCLDAGYAMYVQGGEGTAVNGLVDVTGTTGTWSAGLTSGSSLGVVIEAPQEWAITASSDFVNGSFISAGMTYTSSPSSSMPYIQIEVDGGAACPSSIPRGTFRVEELVYPGRQWSTSFCSRST